MCGKGFIMVTYRQAEKDEYKEIVSLANDVFKNDFEQLLPKTFREDNKVHEITKVAQSDDGKLIAEVCVLPQQLNVGGYLLKSNYLGTVSVHENHRGEGHMIKLMNMCLDDMQGKYDLSVLGGRRQRYEYFGYTYGGEQWEYTINIHNINHALKDVDASQISFAPLFSVENGRQFATEFNKNRKVNVYREFYNIDKILCSYHHTATAVLENDNIIGYLLTADYNLKISELALTDYNNTKKVIKAFFKHFEVPKTEVTLPYYETQLHKELSDFAEMYKMIPCCAFNILYFANVINAYLTLKNETQKISHGRFSAIMDGQPVTITVDENGVKTEKTATKDAVVLSKMDAQKLLLTPSGRFLNLDIPNDWFPLPLFWYYVDCF